MSFDTATPTFPTGEQETTGRYIVALREGTTDAAAMLRDAAGVRMASTADPGIATLEDAQGADGVIFDQIDAAVVTLDPDQARAMGVMDTFAAEGIAANDSVLAIEPERVVYAFGDPLDATLRSAPPAQYTPDSDALLLDALADPPSGGAGAAGASREYLQGYRDSVNALIETLERRLEEGTRDGASAAALSEAVFTWGLQVTRSVSSRFTGRGIRVAILDTGFGPHADFAGRAITLQSFVPGESAADGHGHGTHVTGTACGPRRPRRLPGYGVAPEAGIFIGKVLSNAGRGQDGWILAGINAAVAAGCPIVNMSLGAPVAPGQTFSAVYESVANRALARGTLIIAAAGNDSSGGRRPVSHPANCPSIIAVGALDATLRRAAFSNCGLNPTGGEVNIAAPGVNVYSSMPGPSMYGRMNGTSMAAPHVAGIAALVAQATGRRGVPLWTAIASLRRPLGQSHVEVGHGLAQAIL